MGKRYTEEEKRSIQELAKQGYTDEAIAQQLGRSTNAIRNIRHRHNIKSKEIKSINELRENKQTLQKQTKQLEKELKQLTKRRAQIYQALQVEETQFNKKIEKELTKLKDRKPELFTITFEEQMAKLTSQLAVSFVKWLIE